MIYLLPSVSRQNLANNESPKPRLNKPIQFPSSSHPCPFSYPPKQQTQTLPLVTEQNCSTKPRHYQKIECCQVGGLAICSYLYSRSRDTSRMRLWQTFARASVTRLLLSSASHALADVVLTTRTVFLARREARVREPAWTN